MVTRQTNKRAMMAYDDGDNACDSNGDGEAIRALAAYMEEDNNSVTPPLSESSPPSSSCQQRTMCCESSRSLYCPKCYRILVPKEEWPVPLQDGSLQRELPFDIHILLEDKQNQSTGIQVKSILDSNISNDNEQEELSSLSKVKIFNLEKDEMPPYNTEQDGTYLLFPGDDSTPLSTLLQVETVTVKTLVVLDCKWSKSSSRFHPYLATLPKVSLANPPSKSYFWRWHNTGAGMVCTVEAIYFAAWEITASLGWSLEERQARLVHLLWLFRRQRAVILQRYTQNQVRGKNPHVPFSEEAKEFARNLRRNQANPNQQRSKEQLE